MMADSPHRMNEPAGRVLVCAVDSDSRRDIAADVSHCGFDVRVTHLLDQALNDRPDEKVDVCLVDDADLNGFGLQIASELQSMRRPIQLVCLVSQHAIWNTSAVQCDFLEKPYTLFGLNSVLRSAAGRSRLVAENWRLKRQLSNRALREMVGNSPAMQELRACVQSVAAKEGAVLIQGEPGTGTNLVAYGIHDSSRRAYRPFVRLDCRILSAEVLMRALFGNGNTDGPEQSVTVEDGTLFLDNVDAVALPLQKQLVRAFMDRRVQPPESNDKRPFDVRVIAASHDDLQERIRQGLFREDFFERLSVHRITTTPLCERRDDVGPLTEHFLNCLVVKEGKPVRRVSLKALELLEHYQWPGNDRELQNVIERACSLDFGTRLTAEMLQPWLSGQAGDDYAELPGLTLKEMERKLIETAFTRCGGNRERTARTLKIGLRTLSGKLREYGYPPRGGPGSNQTVASPKAA